MSFSLIESIYRDDRRAAMKRLAPGNKGTLTYCHRNSVRAPAELVPTNTRLTIRMYDATQSQSFLVVLNSIGLDPGLSAVYSGARHKQMVMQEVITRDRK